MSVTTAVNPIGQSIARRHSLAKWLTLGSIGFADFCAFLGAGSIAVLIRSLFHAEFSPRDWLTFAPCVLVFFFVFAVGRLYPGIAINPIEEFRLILRSSSVVFLLIISGTVFLRERFMSSRIVFGLAWLLTIAMVPLCRRFVRGWCSQMSWWGIPTVILGDSDAGTMILKLLQGHNRLGLRPVALLVSENTDRQFFELDDLNVFTGNISDSRFVATQYPDSYALITFPGERPDYVRWVFNEHTPSFRRVIIIPDLLGMSSLAVSAKDICGILAFEVDQKITQRIPQVMKRTFDILLCLLILFLVAPILLALCLAVRLTSRGPIFFGHPRIGRNGRTFRVWKFRTMVEKADQVLESYLNRSPSLREEWQREHKLRRDPRVTPIGRFLRKTSLDELPQLWNVICGEMSLVGPRPIVQSEITKYGNIFNQYSRVTPGITGLWQISGRNNTTYEQRIQIDDYYVRNWSVSLDLYILLRTLKTVFFTEGAY